MEKELRSKEKTPFRDNGRFLASAKPEYIALALFVVLYCVISAFHEPWFDEAQVWQIAKCASLRELLFEIPHYEGHPAFWSLLLAIPAKLGIPFELGLKTIGLIISVASAWVILFKTGYPRLMKLLLPFTYFIFYQYGVIVRPYGIMVLAFLLLSVVFPERHTKPWSFVGLLMLLCLTGAYSIVMAGGIALCYLWEIFREKGIKRLFREAARDRRILALAALLFLAILLVLHILPREDTLVTSSGGTNSFLKCLFIALFTFLGESMLTTATWAMSDTMLLQFARMGATEIVVFSVCGVLLWIILIASSSKSALKYFVVPYLFFALFSSATYFGVHHIGIVFVLLVFWLNILFQDEKRFEIGSSWMPKLAKGERDKKLLTYVPLILGIACLGVSVFWNVMASVNDVRYEYSYGRSTSKWMREHHLEESRIFAGWGWGGWDGKTSAELESDPSDKRLSEDVYFVGNAVLINAYFDHNTCMNLNLGKDDEAYMHYRIATWDEIAYAKEEWKKAGYPELILGKVPISKIYGDEISYDDYSIVYLVPLNRIWKNYHSAVYIPMYARNDILEEHGLEPVQMEGLNEWLNGVVITDEMREQYANGVPVEEILKPYLDAFFGEIK